MNGASKTDQNILVVTGDKAFGQAMSRLITAVPGLQCRVADLAAFLGGSYERGGIDALVLDIDDGAALNDERLFGSRQDVARAPLVMVSRELNHDLARRVIRLGAADWLQKPVDARQVADALLQLVRTTRSVDNRVIAVVSCVGGAGGTSVAIAAAHALARSGRGAANHCALVDLDFTKGSCGTYLDVVNDVDLTGVVETPSRVDAEFMDLVRRDYRDQFAVFSFARPEIAYRPTSEEFVLRMMDVLSYQYRNMVIDVPSHYTPWRDRIFEVADAIALVTELTIPAVRQAQLTYAAIKAQRKREQNVLVVVNKHRGGLFTRGIGRKDVNKTFGNTVIKFIPDDWDVLSDAINRGVAVADAAPRSAFSKKVGDVIASMLAEAVA